eukprot:TRINITY_DN14339_c0_g1_i2.p1 TRINITY_DN14339_c0_g1~~TRINITY_DN14339_c0_g1_i2.p1  ORF type:complete len:1845 (-),score=307.13 TRINITY_DN14339_c0_g1_i2:77-5611(-)
MGWFQKLRLFLRRLIAHRWFDNTVLLMIAANSFTMCLDQPKLQDNKRIQDFLFASAIFFQVVFSTEMVIKLIALGLFRPSDAFFRSGWNLMDLVIVIAGGISLAPQVANVSVVRLLRVLRPLRSVTRVAGLRVLVNCIFKSIPKLLDVFILLTFFLVVFAILGLQLWSGKLHQRCYQRVCPGDDKLCLVPPLNVTDISSERGCSTGSLGRHCPLGQECGVNLAYYKTTTFNYDNFFNALLLVFKVCSTDNWPSDLSAAQDVSAQLAWTYFFTLTIVLSLFTINLILAVLSQVFSTEAEKNRRTAAALAELRSTVMQRSALQALHHAAKSERLFAARNVLKDAEEVDDIEDDRDSFGEQEGKKESPATSISEESSSLGSDSADVPPAELPQLSEPPTVGLDHLLEAASATADAELEQNQSFGFPKEFTSSVPSALRITVSHMLSVRSGLGRPPRGDESWIVWWCTPPEYVNGGFERLRWRVRGFVLSSAFADTMLAVTLFNVLLLLIDYYNAPQTQVDFMNDANIACVAIFALEAVLKIFALGIRGYFKDHFNKLDFVLVLVSIPDLAVSSTTALSAFRGLRFIRMARFLRVLRGWHTLRQLLFTILASAQAVGYLGLLMLLFIFIFAILGMQIFGLKVPQACSDGAYHCPRSMMDNRRNFSTLWEAALTVFILITGENWTVAMQTTMESTTPAAAIYFILVFILGNYIFLNLFIAILIDSFAQRNSDDMITIEEDEDGEDFDEDEDDIDDMPSGVPREESTIAGSEKLSVSASGQSQSRGSRRSSRSSQTSRSSRSSFQSEGSSGHNAAPAGRRRRRRGGGTRVHTLPADAPAQRRGEDTQSDDQGSDDDRSSVSSASSRGSRGSRARNNRGRRRSSASASSSKQRSRAARHVAFRDEPEHREVGGSDPEEPPALSTAGSHSAVARLGFHQAPKLPPKQQVVHRQLFGLARLVTWKHFETIVLLVILVNLVFLAIDRPSIHDDCTLRDDCALQNTLQIANIVFTVLFAIEAVMKIAVFGFWFADDAYLRSPWNCLDLFVVVTAILGLFIPQFAFLRALRALRLLVRSPSIRVLLAALFMAMPLIANVLLVCTMVWIVFAVFGVQLFKGQFFYCDDLSYKGRSECLAAGQQWAHWQFHFDNSAQALLSLFVVALGEWWTDIMFFAIDSTNPDEAPIVNTNPAVALYFVIFTIIGGFFLLSLFIGVLIQRFGEQKQQLDGSVLMTVQQRNWVQSSKILSRAQLEPTPRPPKNRIRRALFFITFMEEQGTVLLQPLSGRQVGDQTSRYVPNRYFETTIAIMVIANMIFIALSYFHSPTSLLRVIDVSNTVFVALFSAEAAIKIAAIGPEMYILDNWNKFDFVVLLLSWVGYTFKGAFRVLLVARVFRLVRKATAIHSLFRTLSHAVPSLFNIGCLLVVVNFVFGVVGVQLFGRIPYTANGLTENMNFQTIEDALLALYQISTTESWTAVLGACQRHEPCSLDEAGNSTCGTSFAVIYFLLYMAICSVVLLNLMITAVLENFTESEFSREKLICFDEFKRLWMQCDPKALRRIRATEFVAIVAQLPAPLGIHLVDELGSQVGLLRLLTQLNVPLSASLHVAYQDVVHALARRVFGVNIEEATVVSKFAYNNTSRFVHPDAFCVHHLFAAQLIISLFRSAVAQRKGLDVGPDPLVTSATRHSSFRISAMTPNSNPLRAPARFPSPTLAADTDANRTVFRSVSPSATAPSARGVTPSGSRTATSPSEEPPPPRYGMSAVRYNQQVVGSPTNGRDGLDVPYFGDSGRYGSSSADTAPTNGPAREYSEELTPPDRTIFAATEHHPHAVRASSQPRIMERNSLQHMTNVLVVQ